MSVVGKRIKEIRQERQISAEELAERIGCAPATIYRYENGSIPGVSSDKLELIAGVLGVHPADLLSYPKSDGNNVPNKTNRCAEYNDIGARIKARRMVLGMSADELADRVGLARATIYRYENASIKSINAKKLRPIATVLQTTPAVLMGWDEPEPTEHALPANIKSISEMKHHYVPLLGGVAAGEPILCETNYDMVIDAPKKADFALRVEGDSMFPSFTVGDVVYLRAQDDVTDGEIGVVLIDDSATMKHIYHVPGGLLLISDNPKYQPMKITAADHDYIRILGKVCGYTRMF